MKKTSILIASLIAILLISLTLLLLGSGEKLPPEEAKSITRKLRNTADLVGSKEVEEKRRKQMEEGIEQANVPIIFFGKVIDQDGIPLEGVTISYRIQQPRAMWDSNSIVGNVLTGPNGGFLITGVKGSSLGIKNFEKKGYRQTKGQVVSFTYSDSRKKYVPDKDRPKVYTLIQEEELPSLIPANGWTTLTWDAKPTRYDIKTGKFGGSGEIQITSHRGEIGVDGKFDWSCKIEAVGGGLYETTIENRYLAASDGYKESLEYGYLSSDPRWGRSTGDKYLFVLLPNGDYGRLEININSRVGLKIGCKINSYLNPTGGRILEYEARRKVKN